MADLFGVEEEVFETARAVEAEIEDAAPEDIVPRNNPDLLGHEGVERALMQDIAAKRLPHAIILAGIAGIGKATLAFRLARFLLAGTESESGSLYVSPRHPVFRRVASGGHADLLVVEREFDEKKNRYKQDISVDAVRRIHPFLRKTAAEGGWRVVIVDGAEYLGTAGQNALLKILEEPPERTLLVLVTSQPGAFLPTIRSRCRLVQLDPLQPKTLSTLLDKLLPELPSDEKTTLIDMAEGSIGKALQFAANDGIALYRQVSDLAAALPRLDMLKVHDLAEKIGRSGAEQSYETAMEVLMQWCEARVRENARSGASSRGLLESRDKIAQLLHQAEVYTLDKRQAVIGAFLALSRPDYQGLNL